MTEPSFTSALAAAVRAVRGESDLDVVMPALADERLARGIACAPETHPLVRAVAALCGGLTGLLDAPTIADPALHGAMAHLIGTRAGREALRAWVEVAPAGWGAAHAAALIDAVQQGVCDPAVAAALIGPCDDAAALLAWSRDAAFAVRRWGRSDPDAPIAWAEALAPAKRDRLIAMVRRDSFSGASCLPWLPPDVVHAAVDAVDIGAALDAFAVASPTARRLHADRIRRLVADARPERLAALTRLACAMQDDDIWRRVRTLIRESPDDAWRVVAAAPWDALKGDVRVDILERADRSSVCAAVACARDRERRVKVTCRTAVAFFAALDPAVWDALDSATQQRWRHALWVGDAHLAVRSLGLRPEVLARALPGNDIVHAARRHAPDAAALRVALLPVALRACDSAAVCALTAALPTPPPDPGAFFCIAGGRDDPSVIIAPARSALRTHDDLTLAVTLQRYAGEGARMPHACAVLRDALRRRSHDDLAPIFALLTDDARAMLMPDADALIARLAHPERQDALQRTLTRLAALPPEVAIPTSVALHQRATRSADASDAAEAIADALRDHGDLFLALADALTDDQRAVVLPLPEDAALADALRGLAHDAPPSARRLALALRGHSWRDALAALLHAPPAHAVAVWSALDDDARQEIGAVIASGAGDIALSASGDGAAARQASFLRAIWMTLSHATRRDLGRHPAFADLTTPLDRSAFRRDLRRRRG